MEAPDAVTGPVNLGNPGEFSIKELAEIVVDKVGSTSELVYAPLPVDDPLQRRPDITLAQEKLGWHPEVPLDDGLQATIDYFRRMMN